MRKLIEKYAWADEEGLAWAVAVVMGRAENEVIRCYGGDPAQPNGPWTFRDAWVPENDFGKYFHLQTLTVGQYVVAIDPNGWTGKSPEIARRVAAGSGQFFSVFWKVEGALVHRPSSQR